MPYKVDFSAEKPVFPAICPSENGVENLLVDGEFTVA